jgi:hypothetical protein
MGYGGTILIPRSPHVEKQVGLQELNYCILKEKGLRFNFDFSQFHKYFQQYGDQELIPVELTNSMEQSPSWGANSPSASQEIPPPSLLWKPKLLCWKKPATGVMIICGPKREEWAVIAQSV